jgi:DNA replication and repair protein RecF
MRNYATLELSPPPGLCALVGANAQGKSNLLEAIALLCIGKSFRTAREREVVRDGCTQAWVSGEAIVRAGSLRLACSLARSGAGTRKTYAVNGHSVRYAAYLGRARVVTFVPADLDLVSGPPARRRALLNAALSQDSAAYYAALAGYAKDIEQKNALLRGPFGPDLQLLSTYDERLVLTGTPIVAARRAYVEALAVEARAVYASIAGARSGDGPLEITYAPNVEETEFQRRLEAARSAELARRMSLVGPHRDDVEFRLDGRSLAAFGSQGQQRSAVLALKVAECRVSTARGGEPPLMLLDDVLSELDPQRQTAFLGAIDDVQQAFVTSTLPLDGLPSATTFRVSAAQLERVA